MLEKQQHHHHHHQEQQQKQYQVSSSITPKVLWQRFNRERERERERAFKSRYLKLEANRIIDKRINNSDAKKSPRNL